MSVQPWIENRIEDLFCFVFCFGTFDTIKGRYCIALNKKNIDTLIRLAIYVFYGVIHKLIKFIILEGNWLAVVYSLHMQHPEQTGHNTAVFIKRLPFCHCHYKNAIWEHNVYDCQIHRYDYSFCVLFLNDQWIINKNNARHLMVLASKIWRFAAFICFISLWILCLASWLDKTSKLKTPLWAMLPCDGPVALLYFPHMMYQLIHKK